MTLADPKPSKRIRDPKALLLWHMAHWDDDCISCGHSQFVEVHHILLRSQGGDDVDANLVGLCSECHGAFHGRPYRAYGVKIDANHVRQALARFLRSEAGDDACTYLRKKLGEFPAEAFVQKLETT